MSREKLYKITFKLKNDKQRRKEDLQMSDQNSKKN